MMKRGQAVFLSPSSGQQAPAEPTRPTRLWEGGTPILLTYRCLPLFGGWLVPLSRSPAGFNEIVARYLTNQPLTLIVPLDSAFKKLPRRIRNQLRGSKLIRYLEANMLLHKLPAEYIRLVQKSAFFDTALGTPLYKVDAADLNDPNAIALSPHQKPTSKAQVARVTKADMCGLKQLTVVVQVVDTVTLPPGLLASATH